MTDQFGEGAFNAAPREKDHVRDVAELSSRLLKLERHHARTVMLQSLLALLLLAQGALFALWTWVQP